RTARQDVDGSVARPGRADHRRRVHPRPPVRDARRCPPVRGVRLARAVGSPSACAGGRAPEDRTSTLGLAMATSPTPSSRRFDAPLPPLDDFPLAAGARRGRAVWSSRVEAFTSYGSKPPLDVLDSVALRAYVDYGLRDRPDGQVELKCRPEDEAATYAMGTANGVYPRLRDVRCPTVVVCGEHTDAIPPPLGEMIVERLP